MLKELETLSALAEHKTMLRAATKLRISQSSVSKRLAGLEEQLGKKVIERQGRKVQITPYGLQLLSRSAPVLAQLREIVSGEVASNTGRISIAIANSIIIAWGAPVVSKIKNLLPGVVLDISVHEERVCIDRVRAGECMLGLAPGLCSVSDLEGMVILEEPMVIIPSGLKSFRFPRNSKLSVRTTEPESETWSAIRRRVRALLKARDVQLEIEDTLQSFAGVVQLAKAGHGHGLTPIGVAKALGVPHSRLMRFPKPGVSRPVSLIGRRLTLMNPLVRSFIKALNKSLPRL